MPFDPPMPPRTWEAWRCRGAWATAAPWKNFLGRGLAAALSAALIGCASPGDPTPRRPVVPLPVTDLLARQIGDAVVLTFTLPATSTEQEPLGETPSVEIYRHPSAAVPPAAKNLRSQSSAGFIDTIPGSSVEQYRRNGRIEFPDSLDPNDLVREPGQQLTYTVRTRVLRARASAESNSVAIRVYLPPEPIQDLHGTLTEAAIVLAWTAAEAKPGTAIAGYRIYRTEIAQDTPLAAIPNPLQAKLLSPLALLNQTAANEYRDATFALGHTYLYTVRTLAQFGADLVESADSNQALVDARDIFPPAIPQGLEVVVVPAAPQARGYVELAWNISTEPDLAGYYVYRSEEPGAPGARLNTDSLSAPTFRDLSVLPGRRYFYKVSAVDRSGNESPPSAEVVAEVPGA